jgi:NAD(P)-dependent dehydrogenase (short-subunit alcohol dehydrogenase family)
VNNAAVLVEKSVSEFTESQFALIHDVNLRAPFLLCRTAGPAMGARGFGRIINVSSVGARTGGLSDSAVYSASKAGLVSMTKHFARILGPGGVTCNAVLPGAIETPMAAAQFARDPDLRESILQRIPLGRYGSGDDVAEAVSFLASDAAGFITGVSLDVNGGWIMV